MRNKDGLLVCADCGRTIGGGIDALDEALILAEHMKDHHGITLTVAAALALRDELEAG